MVSYLVSCSSQLDDLDGYSLGGGIWTVCPKISTNCCLKSSDLCFYNWLERKCLSPVVGLKRKFSSWLIFETDVVSLDCFLDEKSSQFGALQFSVR